MPSEVSKIDEIELDLRLLAILKARVSRLIIDSGEKVTRDVIIADMSVLEGRMERLRKLIASEVLA